MKKFLAIVGTNATNSTNRELLKYMKKHFANQAVIELAEIDNLPLFNKPEDKQLPPEVLALADQIDQHDGVIISTPEYDHAVPAALINALNWLSFEIYPFVDKPVMITGASYGTLGSSRAQAHLRQILDAPELKARVMPSSEYLLAHSLQAFDEQGNLINFDDQKRLEGLFQDFLVFVELSHQLRAAHEQNKQEAANFSWEAEQRH